MKSPNTSLSFCGALIVALVITVSGATCPTGTASVEAHTPTYTQRTPQGEFAVLGTLANGNLLFNEFQRRAIMQYNPSTFASTVWAANEASDTPATTSTTTMAGFRFDPRASYMTTHDRNVFYITSFYGHRIYRIVEDSDEVSPWAGTGVAGAETGVATSSMISSPRGCAVSSDGKLYFSDVLSSVARTMKVDGSTMSLVAGGAAGTLLDLASGIASGAPLGSVQPHRLTMEPGTDNLLFLADKDDASELGSWPRTLVRVNLAKGTIKKIRLVRDNQPLVSTGGRWIYQYHDDLPTGPYGENYQWYRYDVNTSYEESQVGLGSTTSGSGDGMGTSAGFRPMYGGAAFSPDNTRMWFGHRDASANWYPRYIDGFCDDHFEAGAPLPPTATLTPSSTGVHTQTATPSESPTASDMGTPTPSGTFSRTWSRPASASETLSSSQPLTRSLSGTATWPTASLSVTPSTPLTPSVTATFTPPPTKTHSVSLTVTPPPTPTQSSSSSAEITASATVALTQSTSASSSASLPPIGCALGRTRGLCALRSTKCYWSTSVYGACVPLETLALIPAGTVDGALIPREFPRDEPLAVPLYATAEYANATIVFVNATAEGGPGCVNSATELLDAATAVGTRIVASPSSSVTQGFEFTVIAPRNASSSLQRLCVINPTPAAGGPPTVFDTALELRFVESALPQLLACRLVAPRVVYDDVPLDLEFDGYSISPLDRVAVVPLGTNCSDTSAFPAGVTYFPVLSATTDRSQSSYRTAVNGTDAAFQVCYVGPADDLRSLGSAVSCDQLVLRSAGAAPWSHVGALLNVSRARVVAPNTTLEAFNARSCRSLQPADEDYRGTTYAAVRAAVLLSPQDGSTVFGSLNGPYRTNERCAVAIEPDFDPESAADASQLAVVLDVELQLAGEDAAVLVLSSAATIPASPPSIGNSAHTQRFGDSCPTDIDGYRLWHYLPGGARQDVEVRVPRGQVMVIVCTGSEPSLGRRLGVSYRLAESICPNACRDAAGVLRGICNSAAQACTCEDQWRGPSCGDFTGCEVGENAPIITGRGRGTIEHRPTETATVSALGTVSCAYRIIPDASRQGGRRGSLGVGLMLGATASLSSYNCDTHYIRIVAGAHDGREIRRICRSDVERLVGQRVPWLAIDPNTTQPIEAGVYVEVVGDKQDLIDLDYASVALTCPGTPNAAGFVPESAVCSGRGRCIDIAYDEQLALGLLESNKACVCGFPHGAQSFGSTCDTCAFARDPATYPECKGLPPCPNNCSCNGECTPDGCRCNAGFYGRSCNNRIDSESVNGAPAVQLTKDLGMRSPFDNGTSGDATRAGGIDRQIVTCELAGSCLPISRRRGEAYPAAIPPDTIDASSCGFNPLNTTTSTGSRRQQLNETTNAPPVVQVPQFDRGVQLNKLEIPGWLGDFAVESGVAGGPNDISGGFTITAWVQATRTTNGFLYAKTDDARTAEGRFMLLDAAVREVQDRDHRPEVLDRDSLRVYAAVFLNGAKRRVDVMFSRPEGESRTSGSEVTVRHFRLGDDADRLFDGEWRYLTIAFDEDKLRGQVYVDGRTNAISPNYVQCFPFLPPEVSVLGEAAKNASQFAGSVSTWAPGGAVVVGYSLQGNLDEFRAYTKKLAHVTIVEIGGEALFGGELAESEAVLVGMASIGFVVCIAALAVRIFFLAKTVHGRKKKEREAEERTADSNSTPSNEFAAVSEADKMAALEELTATDIDVWVAKRVGASANGLLGKAIATLAKATDIVAEKKGEPRDRLLSKSILALSSDPASPKGIDVDVAADGFFEDEPTNAENEEGLAGDAELKRNPIEVKPVSISAPSDTGDAELPEDSRASTCELEIQPGILPLALKATPERRRSTPQFPQPDPFEPRTFELFMSPIVAPKAFAALRLRQWLRRRYFMDSQSSGSATLSVSLKVLALVLEQHAETFISQHHGTEGWQDHPDTEELKKQLILFAVWRNCPHEDEYAKFEQSMSTTGTLDAGLAEQARAALETCAIEAPQDKAENRRLLAVTAATVMLSAPNALKKQSFRKAVLLGVGNASDMLLNGAGLDAITNGDGEAERTSTDGNSSEGKQCIGSLSIATLFEMIKSAAPRVMLLRDFWQVFALLLSIMTFPRLVTESVGQFASAISLTLDSGNGVPFEVNFAVCCTLGMIAFFALLGCFIRELLTPLGPKRLEMQLRDQMARQEELTEEGKMPGLKVSKFGRLIQFSIVLMTTMYLPTTRVVLMGLLCHESVLCLYDCYVDPTHKLIVAVGAVVLLCVSVLSPLMLCYATLRKQREFTAFVGADDKSDEDSLWAMYCSVDISPFARVYGAFRRRWGQFAVLALVVKSAYAAISLSTEPDTNGQIVAVIMLQLVFTAVSAAVEPFRYRICNVLLTGMQVVVLLLLSLNCIYRINPDEFGPALGQVQLAAVVMVLVVHIPVLVLGTEDV